MRINLVAWWFSLLLQAVTIEMADGLQSCHPDPNSPTLNTTQYILDRESLVMRIATFALQNYENRQALAAACDSSDNCSHLACGPLLRDLEPEALTCETVPNNVDCYSRGNKTKCMTELFSRTRSYVRLSPELTAIAPTARSCDVVTSICAQQSLDGQIFQSTNNNSFTLQAYVYFGSSDGVLHIYPGKEVSPSTPACNDYELRKRPWYLGATALLKEVVVLLDTGPSMAKQLSVALGPYPKLFDASRNVTLSFLDTLTTDDQISVYTFGSSTSIVGQKVKVGTSGFNGSTNADVLVASIKTGIPTPDISSTPANLTAGLMTAVENFDQNKNESLRVIILITAGQLTGQDLPDSLVESLRELNVRVFIHRFLTSDTGQRNDSTTQSLQIVSCRLMGSYDEDYYAMYNPLGVLQSFYSYVAKLRQSLKIPYRPYWVPKYTSSSGIGDLTTVAFPVFSGDVLVGVAGADILIESLEQTNPYLDSELNSRDSSYRRDLSNSSAPPIQCGQVLQNQGDSCPGQTVLRKGVTGFCSDDDPNPDKEEAFKERVCCKECCPWKDSSDAFPPAVIAGIVVGGVLFVIVAGMICACIIWLIWKKCTQSKTKSKPPPEVVIDEVLM